MVNAVACIVKCNGVVMTKKKIEMPKAAKGDTAHVIAKAGLSAIPIVGGPAAELFQHVVQPPLEKRRLEWMAAVGERLEELEKDGLKLEDLENNEQFISTVMHASQIALRTHQQAKLDALRNAVLNVALGQAPEEALQHLFLTFVDSFTGLHLQILAFFQTPPSSAGMYMGGLANVLEQGIPSLRGRRAIYDQFWSDLYTRGLVNTEGLHVMMTGQGLAAKRTTELGDKFLQFISECI